MKTPELDQKDVAKYLSAMSDHDFISFFYAELSDRHVYREERRYMDAHLVLSVAKRSKEDDGITGPWETQLLCPAPGQTWVSDASICQFGSCVSCGQKTASWSRVSVCPVCSEPVHGT